MHERDDRNEEAELEEEQDDAVIGVAFRRSLWILLGLAVAVALVLVVVRLGREDPPALEIDAAAPMSVVSRGEATPPVVRFTDVTRAAGIDWTHVSGATGERFLPETMGGGAAFFDYDGDGDPDLLLVNSDTWEHFYGGAGTGGPRSALYENDGRGSFRDVSRETGLDLRLYGTAVAVGDFDNDGWVDVFIAALGRNRLLRNEARPGGGRHFVDVTARAGVGGEEQEWSSSSTFLDFDNDGYLDLFVGNYVRWSREIDLEVNHTLVGVGRAYGPPFQYEGTFPYLYRNNGDGTFTDVSAEAGVQVRNPATDQPVAKTLGVIPIDGDGDGFTDLVVANDTVRNFYFRNRGDGTFEEVGELYGVAYSREGAATGAMGIDAARYRDDGELGLVIGNFSNEMSSLYVTQGDPTLYADEAIPEGVGAPSRRALTFGIFFFDYDLDGRLDLLQNNGHLESEISKVDPSQEYRQAPQLFWNAGGRPRTFVEVDLETAGDLGAKVVGRGSAFADIDGDGDLDVLLLQTGGRPILLRNDQELGHHWLRVTLEGRGGAGSNRGAHGARVELRAGGRAQQRYVTPTRSYQSQSELAVTFGLGPAARVEELELVVTWPDGSRQTVPVEGVDRVIAVRQEPPPL
ncbi:MAG TPA: CRTAC1 family protein [Thermoanaerobaculia bacterium]|nr:CRTAC1 family protein [Thermoanaerobaculia bacterium]